MAPCSHLQQFIRICRLLIGGGREGPEVPTVKPENTRNPFFQNCKNCKNVKIDAKGLGSQAQAATPRHGVAWKIEISGKSGRGEYLECFFHCHELLLCQSEAEEIDLQGILHVRPLLGVATSKQSHLIRRCGPKIEMFGRLRAFFTL